MTGSCVMKDAVIIKENYGHSLDRLQVQFFPFLFSYVRAGAVLGKVSLSHKKGFEKIFNLSSANCMIIR